MPSDEEVEALLAHHRRNQHNAHYWGHCCNACVGWVWPDDVYDHEAEATERFLRTGVMLPLAPPPDVPRPAGVRSLFPKNARSR